MPTVLLVDDSPLALHAVAQRLRAEGLDVVTGTSVAAGRAVDVSGLACAALDIDLPDGSGVDLAANLLARRGALPVAFFTAGVSTNAVALARTHGPVFHKPDVDALVAWIKRAAAPAAGPQPPPTK